MRLTPCKICGAEFAASRTSAKYCGAKCFRAAERLSNKRHRATFSNERKRAYDVVAAAVNRREIVRRSCEVCGDSYVVAHHDDYAAPLAVRWLCKSHHQQHHIAFGPGKNATRRTAQ